MIPGVLARPRSGVLYVPVATDPYFSNVSLLLHMDGTNGSTTFTDVKGNTFTRVGTPVISTAQSKFGGASLYTANGNSNYLEADSTTLGQFGVEPFTVEGWVRPDTTSEAYGLTIAGNYAGGPAGWTVRYGRNGNTRLAFGCDTALVEVPFVVTAGVWFHFAICRDANGVRIYKDGILAGSTASYGSTDSWASPNKIRIGSDRDGVSGMLGYIDDLRITKGVARYTSNFTPPTAAFPDAGPAATDPYFSNVALLMHCDGTNGSTTFTDVKGNVGTPSGSAQISTAQSKFGGASGAFLNNTDYVAYSSALADLGTAPFTLEAWIRAEATSAAYGFSIAGNYTQAAGTWTWRYGRNGNTTAYFGVDSAYAELPFTVTAGVWFHFAVCRDSAGVRFYKDGQLTGSTSSHATTAFGGAAQSLRVGSDVAGGVSVNGYLDDFRITKGVARYTADFTPPTAAFPDS